MEEENKASQPAAEDWTRRMFEMEKAFHHRLLAESDPSTRRKLYSDFYGRLADFMEEHQPGKVNFGSFSPELMQLMVPFMRGKTVLDFGCGYGFATFDMAIYAGKVVAADEALPMIESMRERVREKGITKIEPVYLGDGEAGLNKYLGAIDVVYSNDVIEHLHPDDAHEHLTLVHRLLGPGGLYICITPNRVTGPHDISAQFLPYHSKAEGAHIREYSHRELCDEFRAAGFVKFRTPITAVGYHRFRSDFAYRSLLVPPGYKFLLERIWFERSRRLRTKILNLFCINKVVLFAWKA